MANAIDILEYLPNSYKTRDEQDYINFLWDSYESNYNNEKYPFAYIAFHMLYMSFVYFEVWQIKETRRIDFEKSLIGFGKDLEKKLIEAPSPFAFWEIGESNFFRFLKLIGSDNSRIGNFTNSVKERNNAAHSNGKIFFNDATIVDTKVNELLNYIEEIQRLSQPVLEDSFIKFLTENWNPDEREYIDDVDQIKEILIHGNYMSPKDIDYLMSFDITRLSNNPNYEKIESLFNMFQIIYFPL